jgi:predicted RNA methylase
MSEWRNISAGPRQVKDLNKAMSALQWEGKNHDEITGVVGGEERRSTYAGMFEPVRPEVTALDEAIRAKYDHQVTSGNVRAIIGDYAAAMPAARESRPVEDSRRSPDEDAALSAGRAARDAEIDARQAAASALLEQVKAKAPAGTKALIYAEYHQDTSDPMTDHFGSRVTRTVAIGFRSSSREDFRALRAAAGRFAETAHLADGADVEHRENYSMGGGNFLSDHGSSDSGTGWVVRSRDFPCAHVSLTQDAVPEPQAAPEPAPAAVRSPAAQPAGPKPARATVIGANVLDILSRATAEGSTVKISGRLNRADYVAVNEVLAAAGGKWNRKAQAHLFDGDAATVLASLLGDGSIVRPQDEGWFPTPDPIVADMIALADLEPGMEVLEPSAGEGAIARAAAAAGCAVDCIEMNAKRAGIIYGEGRARSVTMADFLAVPQRPVYDRVLMNPPFADKADIAHVRHALGFLRPGGLLVAVMAGGVMFRDDRGTAGFRQMAEDAGGVFEPLPDCSFKESGTGVRTVLAVIPALADAQAVAA